MTNSYARPESLVTTDWVAEHLSDPKVKFLEVDVDTASYDKGHIRNAIGWNWQTDLQDRVLRDVVDPRTFAELCRRSGIRPDDTIVLYGDNNNWFAAWALWQFKYHGHRDVRLMNGGRKKWELEKREMTTDPPSLSRSEYPIPATDESIRAYRQEVMDTLGQGRINLVDVRCAGRIHRQDHCAARHDRNRAAGRSHSRCRKAFPGPKPPTKTAHSRLPTSCESYTPTPASIFQSRRSHIAASASEAAIPGSC